MLSENSSVSLSLKFLALEAHERGGSLSGQVCPICNGGRHKERSLSITSRPDGIALWMCHRANCGQYGRFEISTGKYVASPTTRKTFEPRPYQHATRSLGSEERAFLTSTYGLVETDFKRGGVFVEERSGRLGFPVYGPRGLQRGVETRKYLVEQDGPKTLHYKWIDEPWLGWQAPKEVKINRPIVLVEDIISALKVSRQFIAVSLMGSHMGLEDIMEVSKLSDNILLCLDKDATKKALALKERFLFVAPKLKVIFLEQDLKYETDQDINTILDQARTRTI